MDNPIYCHENGKSRIVNKIFKNKNVTTKHQYKNIEKQIHNNVTTNTTKINANKMDNEQ